MFGEDLIKFIKDNGLEKAQLFDGFDDLPGYMSAKQFAKDMNVKECVVKDWIGWKLIPEAIHVGEVWYVPCDLILVSEGEYQKALESAKKDDTADDGAVVTSEDALLVF